MRKQVTNFAITALALLIYPLSLSSQNNFSLSLDANDTAGDQAVTSLNTSPDQVVSIQIFGTNIQNARSLSTRFEYDESQVVYEGFDAGDVWPGTPHVFPEQGTNPTYVEIGLGSLGGQVTVNSGWVGTIRFRTTATFSGTAIRLVRGVIGRGGQLETVTLTARVELQSGSVATAPSPDFDGDGVVGIPDFLLFVDRFGSSRGDGTYQERYDLDGNDVIGIPDFLILVDNFGKEVPTTGGGGGGGGSPDLIVESPSVSDEILSPGQSFTLGATVRNQGNSQSAATTLRYYRSTGATITTSDTSVGTDAVESLSASGTSSESISLQASNTSGAYYYGACVESVSRESDTENNCSTGVRVTVEGGNTFDQTVAQIKNLETKLEQNRNRIEQEISQQRQNHPLNAPKDQFETDAEYAARQSQLNAILAESRQRLLVRYDIKNTQTQIAQLYRKTFPTNDITVTLGTYNANSEYFPITFEATLNGEDRRYEQRLTLNRDDARSLYNNWNKVIAKGYLSIDPGYRQALVWVELKYTPIWPQGFWWERNEVYDLGDDNYAVAFSPDGKYIATGGNGENTSIWEVSSGRELRQTTHSGTVYAVTFSPDGQYLATGDATYVSLWQLSNNELLWSKYQVVPNFSPFYTSYADYLAVAFSPDGKFLATGSTQGVTIIEVNGGADLWGKKRVSSANYSFVTTYASFEAVAYSPNGQYLATGDTLNDAIIWDASNGTIIHQIGHSDKVWEATFSSDGKYLITGDNAGNVSIIEVSSGQKIQVLSHEGGWIGAVTYSPDGAYLAVGHENKKITIYRMGQETIRFDSEIVREKSIEVSREVYEVAWHPCGHLISDGNKVYRVIPRPDIQED